jgi:Holliday junction DNA helicase RuvB
MARPLPTFNEFVGQKPIVARLRRLLVGAMQKGEPFPHSIFSGPSGIGKTELASALASEANTVCHVCYGDVLPTSLIETLSTVKVNDIAFIDEAHNLSRECQELLYRAIDDGIVPMLGEDEVGSDGKTAEKSQPVNPFTIILATDQPGGLQKAMRERIEVEVELSYYSIPELKQIIAKICSEANIKINSHATTVLAEISRGVPRVAKKYARMLRLWYPAAEKSELGKPEIDAFCQDNGIDPTGLKDRDRQYLVYLRDAEQASLGTIALTLGLDEREVRRFVEPYLFRLGLIQIDSGGRSLTKKGFLKADELKQNFTKGNE